MQELEKILEEIDREIEEHRKDPEMRDVDICYGLNRAKDIIRRHMNDGWILVGERLPDDEAKEFIDEKYKGFGHLYPCLATYKNPATGRIYTAKFYYDICEKWFVNSGEVLLPKDNVLAWRPLPEPYRPERSEE